LKVFTRAGASVALLCPGRADQRTQQRSTQ
jgi:hypothetical protein